MVIRALHHMPVVDSGFYQRLRQQGNDKGNNEAAHDPETHVAD
jgi:hypothetical protein